jgi:hypothetical protein
MPSGSRSAVRPRALNRRTASGAGTQLLLAAVSDAAHPTWRTTALGIYLSWRDVGHAIGALVGGVTAVLTTLDTATLLATLTAVSGLLTRSPTTAMKAVSTWLAPARRPNHPDPVGPCRGR